MFSIAFRGFNGRGGAAVEGVAGGSVRSKAGSDQVGGGGEASGVYEGRHLPTHQPIVGTKGRKTRLVRELDGNRHTHHPTFRSPLSASGLGVGWREAAGRESAWLRGDKGAYDVSRCGGQVDSCRVVTRSEVCHSGRKTIVSRCGGQVDSCRVGNEE